MELHLLDEIRGLIDEKVVVKFHGSRVMTGILKPAGEETKIGNFNLLTDSGLVVEFNKNAIDSIRKTF